MTEDQLQKDIVTYLDTLTNCFYSMINNELGLFRGHKSYYPIVNRLINLGFKPGLPDLFVVYKNKAFFVELKVGKNKLSKFQKKWFEILNNSQVKAYEVRSLEELIDIIIKL